jgi:hypothetical protein
VPTECNERQGAFELELSQTGRRVDIGVKGMSLGKVTLIFDENL